jgi:hypothetical protein
VREKELICDQVKGEVADYGIRIDKQLIALFEVKFVPKSWISGNSGRCRCTPRIRVSSE